MGMRGHTADSQSTQQLHTFFLHFTPWQVRAFGRTSTPCQHGGPDPFGSEPQPNPSSVLSSEPRSVLRTPDWLRPVPHLIGRTLGSSFMVQPPHLGLALATSPHDMRHGPVAFSLLPFSSAIRRSLTICHIVFIRLVGLALSEPASQLGLASPDRIQDSSGIIVHEASRTNQRQRPNADETADTTGGRVPLRWRTAFVRFIIFIFFLFLFFPCRHLYF